jgi:Na+-translocating ferredoxin:NAD+ oxidoreductase subunit D
MSTQILTISPSPHIHAESTVKSLMYGVIIAMMPALLVSFWVFGLGAVYVTLLAVLSCVLFEYLIVRYLLQRPPVSGTGRP